MKIKTVIIFDDTTETYFGFRKNAPGICASGKTIDEVNSKIEKALNEIIDLGLYARFKK